MNKFALIGLSLLVLVIGCGVVCASHADDSLQAVDGHGNMDDMNGMSDVAIQHDANGQASPDHAGDIQLETGDPASAGQGEPLGNDLQAHQDKDSGADHADEVEPTGAGPQANDNTDHGQNSTDANVVSDNIIRDSAVGAVDLTKSQSAHTTNIIDDTPKETDTSAQKQDLLRPDIEKYNKYFLKNRDKTMPNGKKFSKMDLLLEIHKHYSFEDTIIIAMHVLRDNGVRVTFPGLEGLLKAMGDGTLHTYADEMNASYYKNEMDKIHESHKSLNIEAKKYSDMFNRKNGKLICDRVSARYCYLDLILQVYQKHSSLEETILISTYALKNSGMNVTAASIEHTVNQMMKGTIRTDNTEYNTPSFYYFNMNLFKTAHERGVDISDVDLEINHELS